MFSFLYIIEGKSITVLTPPLLYCMVTLILSFVSPTDLSPTLQDAYSTNKQETAGQGGYLVYFYVTFRNFAKKLMYKKFRKKTGSNRKFV